LCKCNKIILTTKKASIGIDFIFEAVRAFIISIETLNSMDELYQPLGRSSRKDPNLSLLGAVFTMLRCNDITSLKQGLVDKSSDLVLFSSQCRMNIKIL